MSQIKFKTNINCSGCIAKVGPFLDSDKSIEHWEVDTSNPEKILTVSGNNINTDKIKDIVVSAGFEVKGEIKG